MAAQLSACDYADSLNETQSLTIALSTVFALYLIVDSVIVGFVVMRKSMEAELHGSAMKVVGEAVAPSL